jgi:hypothetical protein
MRRGNVQNIRRLIIAQRCYRLVRPPSEIRFKANAGLCPRIGRRDDRDPRVTLKSGHHYAERTAEAG